VLDWGGGAAGRLTSARACIRLNLSTNADRLPSAHPSTSHRARMSPPPRPPTSRPPPCGSTVNVAGGAAINQASPRVPQSERGGGGASRRPPSLPALRTAGAVAPPAQPHLEKRCSVVVMLHPKFGDRCQCAASTQLFACHACAPRLLFWSAGFGQARRETSSGAASWAVGGRAVRLSLRHCEPRTLRGR
jgi:hypothetical protein